MHVAQNAKGVVRYEHRRPRPALRRLIFLSNTMKGLCHVFTHKICRSRGDFRSLPGRCNHACSLTGCSQATPLGFRPDHHREKAKAKLVSACKTPPIRNALNTPQRATAMPPMKTPAIVMNTPQNLLMLAISMPV